jgi:hypothetical protein
MKKLLLILLFTNYSFADELTYICQGLSHFELFGASGAKEEQQSREYKFENLTLIDLNNIECDKSKTTMTCKSTLLNIRTLNLDLQTLKITDSISGNKGFGHYIENFEGQCQIK